MMRFTKSIVAVIALGAVAPAFADDYLIWEKFGDWKVVQLETVCVAEKAERQGSIPSTLMIHRLADGRSAVEIGNDGWSVSKGEEQALYVLIDHLAFETKSTSPRDHYLLIPADDEIIQNLKSAEFVTFFPQIK